MEGIVWKLLFRRLRLVTKTRADMLWQARSAFDTPLCHLPEDLVWLLPGDVLDFGSIWHPTGIGLSDSTLSQDVRRLEPKVPGGGHWLRLEKAVQFSASCDSRGVSLLSKHLHRVMGPAWPRAQRVSLWNIKSNR